MRTSIVFAVLSYAATSFAQAVPEGIAPEAGPPEGCEETVDGNFTIGIAVFTPSAKRETAQDAAGSALACTLEDGVLRDPYGRTGSVVANYQFQFDGPPQAGAIYTGGFSRCENGSLAIGDSARWWRCMSGEFGNLYDRSIGDQCTEVRIVAQLVSPPESSSPSASSVASSTPVSSSWSVESATTTASVTSDSLPATVSSSLASDTGSPSASITPTPSATDNAAETPGSPPAPTGGAALCVPQTFGVVIGILGAALML